MVHAKNLMKTTSFPRDKKENMQWGRVWKGGGGAEDLRKEMGGI